VTVQTVAIQYTCSNPGQTALLWAWQPAPFGHGWIDVKQEPLVRLSEVEALALQTFDLQREINQLNQQIQRMENSQALSTHIRRESGI
jgi:hypothetical protein